MNLRQLKVREDVTDIVLNVKSLALKCVEGTKISFDAKDLVKLRHQTLHQ